MPTWIARTELGSATFDTYFHQDGTDLRRWDDFGGGPSKEATVGTKSLTLAQLKKVVPIGFESATFVRTTLEAGEHYPRIWRGEKNSASLVEDAGASLHLAFQSAGLLFQHLRAIFRTVQPETNRRAHGHEIRALLILACTEVENSWRAIFRANRPAGSANERWTTRDYVKLLKPLRLREWVVAMPSYLKYGDIQPFGKWSPGKPTESLRWYADYNATKHDREHGLRRATVESTVNAVAAVYVMLLAQVGPQSLASNDHLPRDFAVRRQPAWPLRDRYIPPREMRPVAGSEPRRFVPAWRPVPLAL